MPKIDQSEDGTLLYSRKRTAEVLGGVSSNIRKRLEAEGRLKPFRLTKSPTAQVFYKVADVRALVR
jgi:hypothetical protein